jgi:hypothetical protein
MNYCCDRARNEKIFYPPEKGGVWWYILLHTMANSYDVEIYFCPFCGSKLSAPTNKKEE